MKVFLTGGTGFIGGHVAAQLRARDDEVRALARSAEKGARLAGLGCEVVVGDLSSTGVLEQAMDGVDAVIHGAAVYKVGIPKSKRPAMREANVDGTRHVLDAAQRSGAPRVVYVSTVGVFGATQRQVVDESAPLSTAFCSYYEETKVEAHRIALERIAAGAPIVIVQPGGVYGPQDHSELGNLIDQTITGKLKLLMLPDFGASFVYVEDVAAGILLALDKGRDGEPYILAGETGTMGDLVRTVARVAGVKAPSRTMPTALIRAVAPLGPVLGPALGFPPNLREVVSSAAGVTYWARSDKAERELGYAHRGLEQGLRDTLRAEGRLPASQ